MVLCLLSCPRMGYPIIIYVMCYGHNLGVITVVINNNNTTRLVLSVTNGHTDHCPDHCQDH